MENLRVFPDVVISKCGYCIHWNPIKGEKFYPLDTDKYPKYAFGSHSVEGMCNYLREPKNYSTLMCRYHKRDTRVDHAFTHESIHKGVNK